MSDFVLDQEFESHNPTAWMAAQLVYERKYPHYLHLGWPTEATFKENPTLLEGALASHIKNHEGSLLLDRDNALHSISVGGPSGNVKNFNVMTWNAERPDERNLKATYEELFPRIIVPKKDTHTYVTFWYMTDRGPRQIRRQIAVPSWEEIADNYTESIRGDLEWLIDRDQWDTNSGQLILWQGSPGTGKTYALRSMARRWKSWANVHYITDPEKFFGSSADYMLQVLFSEDNDPYDFDDDSEDEDKTKWKLLILEDSGELLATTAKEQVGQALSRLLNVVDGMIGQGLKLLVLVTTNEDFKRLHPAVSRFGRCASRIEFLPLSVEEANEWCEQNEVEGVQAPHTISELFAHKDGKITEKVEVGFH